MLSQSWRVWGPSRVGMTSLGNSLMLGTLPSSHINGTNARSQSQPGKEDVTFGDSPANRTVAELIAQFKCFSWLLSGTHMYPPADNN